MKLFFALGASLEQTLPGGKMYFGAEANSHLSYMFTETVGISLGGHFAYYFIDFKDASDDTNSGFNWGVGVYLSIYEPPKEVNI